MRLITLILKRTFESWSRSDKLYPNTKQLLVTEPLRQRSAVQS